MRLEQFAPAYAPTSVDLGSPVRLVASSSAVQYVPQRVADRDHSHQDPFHSRASREPLVVRAGVSCASTTPNVITTIPSQWIDEIRSRKRKCPAIAISTYELAVIGKTKLRSARLRRARSPIIQKIRTRTPNTAHGLANAQT